MSKHSKSIRAYHRPTKAWYKDQMKGRIEVSFGMYNPKGGTTGECIMQWIELNGESCAQLKSFEDSWSALNEMQDVIKELAKLDSQLITEQDFINLLDKLSFKDLTAYNK